VHADELMATLEAMLLTSRGAVTVGSMVEALDDGHPTKGARSPRSSHASQAIDLRIDPRIDARAALAEEVPLRPEPQEPEPLEPEPLETEPLETEPLETEPPKTDLSAQVRAALERLCEAWDHPDRGLRLERVAGGWRFVTPPQLDTALRTFHGLQARQRLSQAALEVLSIVAHRQPVTQPEINFIRGTSSSGVVRTLLDRKLLRVAGRKKVVGKPFLYRTTKEFLMHFGLERVEDIPEPETLVEDTAALALEADDQEPS